MSSAQSNTLSIDKKQNDNSSSLPTNLLNNSVSSITTVAIPHIQDLLNVPVNNNASPPSSPYGSVNNNNNSNILLTFNNSATQNNLQNLTSNQTTINQVNLNASSNSAQNNNTCTHVNNANPTTSSNGNMTGYLNKWTNYIKGYQKRWFSLNNGLLSYYR
jgi:hypothetical protein